LHIIVVMCFKNYTECKPQIKHKMYINIYMYIMYIKKCITKEQ